MIALEWDPDRYDYLSENRLFFDFLEHLGLYRVCRGQGLEFFAGFRSSKLLQLLLRSSSGQ